MKLMRPPRLKLRTLIVLVALATLGVGGVEYRRRAARYRALASEEALLETDARLVARESQKSLEVYSRIVRQIDAEESSTVVRQSEEQPAVIAADALHSVVSINQMNRLVLTQAKASAALAQRRADFHTRRRAAFLRCARYPWLSPPDEEPEPK